MDSEVFDLTEEFLITSQDGFLCNGPSCVAFHTEVTPTTTEYVATIETSDNKGGTKPGLLALDLQKVHNKQDSEEEKTTRVICPRSSYQQSQSAIFGGAPVPTPPPVYTCYSQFCIPQEERLQIRMAEILHQVQVHHVFPDSKEFVDMPMKHDPDTIVDAWEALINAIGRPEELHKDILSLFVHEHFLPCGCDSVGLFFFSRPNFPSSD